jgi:hypothetical protein
MDDRKYPTHLSDDEWCCIRLSYGEEAGLCLRIIRQFMHSRKFIDIAPTGLASEDFVRLILSP